MKKMISVCMCFLFIFLSVAPSSAFAAGADPVGEINAFHKLVYVSPKPLFLDRGQAFKLSVSLDSTISNYSVSWTSSNPSVASVTSYGLVVAKTAGTAVITVSSDAPMIQGYTYFDTCTVTVSSNKIVEDGTYFIQTAQKNGNGKLLDAYVGIENHSTVNGSKMEAQALSGHDYKKWEIALGLDGYYTIGSVYSSKYMRVTNSSALAGATITQNGTVVSGSKWSLMLTASGNYTFVPASSTSSLVVLNLPGNTSGCDLNTAYYSNDSDYKDEWVLNRMLPTSGYELDYEPSCWAGYVENCCNCYAYAINSQTFPGTNFLYYKQQMGWYKGPEYEYSALTLDSISSAVLFDYSEYNSNFNASLVFQPIGRYDVCPAGTYKVALVTSNNDYHWYRQDSDGLWSHKQGTGAVNRKDHDTRYIIDPQTADRGGYTNFLGYFAVSPWNEEYTYSDPVYCYVVVTDTSNDVKYGLVMPYDDLMSLIDSQLSGITMLSDGSIRISNISDLTRLGVTVTE